MVRQPTSITPGAAPEDDKRSAPEASALAPEDEGDMELTEEAAEQLQSGSAGEDSNGMLKIRMNKRRLSA